MEYNLKYDLDDTVYYIGAGKIYQAKICEARLVNRWEQTNSGNCARYNTFTGRIYEMYRLYKLDKNGDVNSIAYKHSYKDGEYSESSWFEKNELFESVEAAIEYLKSNIEYLTNNKY